MRLSANRRLLTAAGMALAVAGVVMLATPLSAQQERTGVSRPEPAMISATPEPDVAPVPVPESSVPATSPTGGTRPSASVPMDVTAIRRPLASEPAAVAPPTPIVDPDAGIVTHVFAKPGEVPEGTLVKVKLSTTVSTVTTKVGSMFSAEVTEPVTRDGRVIIPAGAILEGQVTELKGGKRFGGRAAIHLEPKTVTLPDGSLYVLHARVIDSDQWGDTRVDDEGTILRKDHTKGAAVGMGLAAGGGAAAGAMIAGVPGALIGAGVGAGAATVVWLKQDRQAELPKNLRLIFSLTESMAEKPVKDAAAKAWTAVPRGE